MNYDNCIIRPYMGRWAIYHFIGANRAEVIFQGSREACSAELRRICEI